MTILFGTNFVNRIAATSKQANVNWILFALSF